MASIPFKSEGELIDKLRDEEVEESEFINILQSIKFSNIVINQVDVIFMICAENIDTMEDAVKYAKLFLDIFGKTVICYESSLCKETLITIIDELKWYCSPKDEYSFDKKLAIQINLLRNALIQHGFTSANDCDMNSKIIKRFYTDYPMCK